MVDEFGDWFSAPEGILLLMFLAVGCNGGMVSFLGGVENCRKTGYEELFTRLLESNRVVFEAFIAFIAVFLHSGES